MASLHVPSKRALSVVREDGGTSDVSGLTAMRRLPHVSVISSCDPKQSYELLDVLLLRENVEKVEEGKWN
ncbi:hypothetical protein HPB50_016555 [Hyalomma asiaticum]|uniref:Uncharacterized protein n=1 Tax=Hyalomma asiaticum TaxID=266040 RepID=A0ACB7SZ22_HYAAI|nr:hypothetical protein HPB50_016555 [Hyalomma asiaticum]